MPVLLFARLQFQNAHLPLFVRCSRREARSLHTRQLNAPEVLAVGLVPLSPVSSVAANSVLKQTGQVLSNIPGIQYTPG